MPHSFKHKVDAVITSRGADASVQGIYMLVDQGTGPFIAEWTPPDVSYGEKPTDEELNAVTEEQGDEAFEAGQEAMALQIFQGEILAQSIVEVLSEVAGEDVTDQVLEKVAEKLA
jgi:hypothetical protein